MSMRNAWQVPPTLRNTMSRLSRLTEDLFHLISTHTKKTCSATLTIIVSVLFWLVDKAAKVFLLSPTYYGTQYSTPKKPSQFWQTKGQPLVRCWEELRSCLRTFLSSSNPVVNLLIRVLLSLAITVALLLLPLVGLLFGACLLICSISMSLLLLSEQVNSILPPIQLSRPVWTQKLSSRLPQMVSETFSTIYGKVRNKVQTNINRFV